MKASTMIIIVLSVCLIIAIGISITSVTISQNIVLKKEMEIKDLKTGIQKAVISKNMRDDILQDIKIQVPFKNLNKIKLKLDEWETLKAMEKIK